MRASSVNLERGHVIIESNYFLAPALPPLPPTATVSRPPPPIPPAPTLFLQTLSPCPNTAVQSRRSFSLAVWITAQSLLTN